MPPKGRSYRRSYKSSQPLSGLEFLSQRAKELSIQLKNEKYLCCICMERIRQQDYMVSCPHCFNGFHHSCMTQWVQKGEHVLGCPNCRSEYDFIDEYRCFCGKRKNPPFDPYVTPHSCGDQCEKARPLCEHPCKQQRHPGPCVECGEIISKTCPCGATRYTFACGKGDLHKLCGGVCDRILTCGKHRCQQTCHEGPCAPCAVWDDQPCVCGKASGTVACGTSFSCGLPCGKLLPCGVHECQRQCHSGPCSLCPTDPNAVKTCPCGSLSLNGMRSKCTDPIPTCNLVCGKRLSCGRHTCPEKCHASACAPCAQSVKVQCRCGKTNKVVPCADSDKYTCDRVCGTRLSCGRHYCGNTCCSGKGNTNAEEHVCFERCSHKLQCGHFCGEPCHRGPCPPCIHVSSEPISCFCGRLSLPPPQPCGMEHLSCGFPCQVVAACGHAQPSHCCHFGPCPPCGEPVPKRCVGGHCDDVMAPCSCGPDEVKCSGKCEKQLPCGHLCVRNCHTGTCLQEGQTCKQPCGAARADCGHLCKTPCHPCQACPECKERIKLSCKCGYITKRYTCTKVRELQSDSPDEFFLPCEYDCLHAQRLSALRDRCKNPVQPPDPIYSLALWNLASTNSQFVLMLEEKLNAFCDSDETLISLPPCNREKRSIIHMVSKYYYIKSFSTDDEPKRNCVLTKTPNTAVPTLLLSAAVQKDESDPSVFLKRYEQDEDLTLLLEGEGANEATVGNILFDFVGSYVYVGLEECRAALVFSLPQVLDKIVFFLKTAPRPFHFKKKRSV
ncbi:transcriptional repressor NF-X1 [Strigomonas culicis]|uniref:Transcriptional repressor NF-X1 n=1 Tax=Strigomonas culicis TaxID=28005 RepID=S9V9K6_9TRYP|nr:transcriptional repressor NF-X1 [Strigomonas culicis]EPY30060.1 transcriptional repressor NF-X1 [Strigomonas culicis]|eukprot:EPY19635.1 transcriptional repressor NF-X1 [Strigomonas culicis]